MSVIFYNICNLSFEFNGFNFKGLVFNWEDEINIY